MNANTFAIVFKVLNFSFPVWRNFPGLIMWQLRWIIAMYSCCDCCCLDCKVVLTQVPGTWQQMVAALGVPMLLLSLLFSTVATVVVVELVLHDWCYSDLYLENSCQNWPDLIAPRGCEFDPVTEYTSAFLALAVSNGMHLLVYINEWNMATITYG